VRSLPPFLRGSREWQSCGSLARAVWQDVRPRRGDLVVHVAAGGAAVDALASVLSGYGWDLRHAEVAAVLGEWERVGLCERAPVEGDGAGELLRVCAIPPTVTAELERLRRGPQGGLTAAEKQAAYRERQRASRGPSSSGAEGAVTGNGDGPKGGNNFGNSGAPAAPLSPSSGPPKGAQREGEGAAPATERPEAPAEGRRSAVELAGLEDETRGALALARLGKGVGAELLDPRAARSEVVELGRAVAALGLSEVELLGVAAWLRVDAEAVRKALSWSRSIRGGGALTVGFLLSCSKQGREWAGLRAVVEVGVAWARKTIPAAFAGPVKATPGGELGAARDTGVAR
jgi:hypothetical protein